MTDKEHIFDKFEYIKNHKAINLDEQFSKHPWADKVNIPKTPVLDEQYRWDAWEQKELIDMQECLDNIEKGQAFLEFVDMNDEKRIKQIMDQILPMLTSSFNASFIMYAILDASISISAKSLKIPKKLIEEEAAANRIKLIKIAHEKRKEDEQWKK